MFDMEADNHSMLLGQKAVLTPVACPVANKLAYGVIHQLAILCSNNRTSLRLQNRNEINHGDIGIVFLAFCRRQLTLITFVCKFINTGLRLLIDAKIDKPPGDFRGEKRPKWIKKAVEYVSSNHADSIAHRRCSRSPALWHSGMGRLVSGPGRAGSTCAATVGCGTLVAGSIEVSLQGRHNASCAL